jgi:protein-S-isoprenylcysteine O-methyltransferase Ste14
MSLYLKLFEEKELEERFGSDYIEYKRKTPFLIPRFTKEMKQAKET